MMRNFKVLFLLILTGLCGSSYAQSIYGRILDDKKQPAINVTVRAISGGIVKGGAVSDYDGKYEIKPLEGGLYDLIVTSIEFDSITLTGISLANNDDLEQNFKVGKTTSTLLPGATKIAYKKPLVGSLTNVKTAEEIKQMPTTQVADVAALSAGSHQTQRGAEINMGGSRVEGTVYVIDGVTVQYVGGNRSGVDMAQNSVEQIEVISSGIEAKYGDVAGGVINITTKGVSKEIKGNLTLEHSIDGYNNNFISAGISGPLYKKTIIGEDGTKTKKPVMGFALNAEYHDDQDRYPAYIRTPVLNSSVLNDMVTNPLHAVIDNTGQAKVHYASDYVTPDQITYQQVAPNNTLKEFRANGKIDFQPTDLMHVVVGGRMDYVSMDLYNVADALFAPTAIPKQNNFNGSGYIRFTQKFGKANDTVKSIISNAYYTLQADFQQESSETQNNTWKKDYFSIGYNGKFTVKQQPIYSNTSDSLLNSWGKTNPVGTVVAGTEVTGISYTPSDMNPTLANYNKQLFSLLNGNIFQSLQQVQSYSGLLNGDEPGATYSISGSPMYASPGATYGGYSIFRSNQYGLTVDASFDLTTGKIRHSIQFGGYYQQRVISDFGVSAAGSTGSPTQSIWTLARLYANSISNGGLILDKQNPIYRINGKNYTFNDIKNGSVIWNSADTVIYNYKNIGNSTFDANLRKELNIASGQDINIDALTPSQLSLNLFSADELLNSGHPFVSYYGYTYTGGEQTGTVNFNDYWTKKDANGDYTRPVAAFNPNYLAGYIQDKFRFEDIKFNIGVRVDRYSANTKILSDPYSEYPELTVSQVSGAQNSINGKSHPGNMGGNYVVYVDDNNSNNPNIIGYRSGNNWYDATGKFIEDPSVLLNYSNGRNPQPYIPAAQRNIKITDTNFNPNLSFTDYTPQVTVMPRIQLSFPISDVADFFAHYDIYAQRPYPNSIAISTPETYYTLQANNTSIIPNAALLPSKTIDYEVGFQQKLTDFSALTITGFYKERKDMVTVVPYLYAWPTTYYTYGNRDFSTTKGTTFKFDYRTTAHLRMEIDYTLQFAEGSGSSYASNSSGGANSGILANFIQAGVPNLRYVTALDYDSRHTISANIDYRYGPGEGPVVGKYHILENAGADLVVKVRSGEPYTLYSEPDNVAHVIIGSVNGARLPWHYGLDLKLDKSFTVQRSRKQVEGAPSVKTPRSYYVNVYLYFQNLLNTQDILGVYGYTSKPNDNGYITSAFGQQYIPQQISPSSYTVLLQNYFNSPGAYNYARTVNFGVNFSF
jgi:Carboxypeptidase regulatory-like domain/TonB-dependent Receptor Plug Domain